MSNESTENTGGQVAEAERLAVRYKELLPLVVAVLAGLYGFGWLIETFALSSVGLGDVSVSREKAVAAGTSFSIACGPAIGVFATSIRSKKKPWYWLIASCLLGPFLLFFGRAAFDGPSEAVWLGRVAVFGSTFAVFLGLGMFQMDELRSSVFLESKLLRIAAVAGFLSTLGLVYAAYLVPMLPSALGGFTVATNHMTLKEPDEEFDADVFFIDSDSVLYSRRNAKATKSAQYLSDVQNTKLERIPWDRVVRLQRAPVTKPSERTREGRPQAH